MYVKEYEIISATQKYQIVIRHLRHVMDVKEYEIICH